MLNRRILRIKAFKVLYGSVISGSMSLSDAFTALDASCEATRDLYLYMLGLVAPLTETARARIDALRSKFNPTEEERNPNMKFAQNRLAVLLDEDPDFKKLFAKKKFSWAQYDIFLNNLLNTIVQRDYFVEYMASEKSSLAEDCRLFTRIFEEELADNMELEQILEDKSMHWYEDLPYSLTWCCRTFKSLSKGERWSLPPLYQSDLLKGPEIESDMAFVRRLTQASFANYETYSSKVAESVQGWEKDRLYLTDVILISMGLAEAVTFPTIPVKVTINEYVELSKHFGTPKSRAFVNGLLDKLIQTMVNDGLVVKEGKGLM